MDIGWPGTSIQEWVDDLTLTAWWVATIAAAREFIASAVAVVSSGTGSLFFCLSYL
jgi:hypothetical protein